MEKELRTWPWNPFSMVRAKLGVQTFSLIVPLNTDHYIQMGNSDGMGKIVNIRGISVWVSYFKKTILLWSLDADITRHTLKLSAVFSWTLLKTWHPAFHVYELLMGTHSNFFSWLQPISLSSPLLCGSHLNWIICVTWQVVGLCLLVSEHCHLASEENLCSH